MAYKSLYFFLIVFMISCNENVTDESESFVNNKRIINSITTNDTTNMYEILEGYVGFYSLSYTILGCDPIQFIENSSGEKYCFIKIFTSNGSYEHYFQITESSSTITKKKLTCSGCNGTCEPCFDLVTNKAKCCGSCEEGQSCTETWTDVKDFVTNHKNDGANELATLGYPNVLNVTN